MKRNEETAQSIMDREKAKSDVLLMIEDRAKNRLTDDIRKKTQEMFMQLPIKMVRTWLSLGSISENHTLDASISNRFAGLDDILYNHFLGSYITDETKNFFDFVTKKMEKQTIAEILEEAADTEHW